ncbi:tetratricopeptide (TPR) repeat protein [Kroppenstedtia sanguinis]|uniref:helix-turn-helix domain-containing protein n=1 Tax=Kroppenstedtia sanguinis TaxID=1380684 RepID=UPI003D246086
MIERREQAIGLGNNIRYRRKELGLTQSELAEGIISVPYLSLIENEKAHPKPDILSPLAKRLHSSVKDLLGVIDAKDLRRADFLIDKIRTSLMYERYGEAKASLEELKKLSGKTPDQRVHMKTDLIEINFLIHFSKKEKYQTKLAAFEQRWGDPKEDINLRVWYLRIKGNIHFLHDMYDQALLCYNQAEKLLPQVTDDTEKAYIYGNLGKTHLTLSDPALGILYTEKAINIMLKQDRWLEVCSMFNTLGACYTNKGNFQGAIECFERVLRIADQFKFSNILISRTYHELGVCYLRLEDCKQAIYYLNRSLEVVSPSYLPAWEEGFVHQILCQTYLKTGDLDQAQVHIEKAIPLLESRERLKSECLIFLGQIYYHRGNYQQFIRYYQEAIQSFLRLGTPENTARATHTLGKHYIQSGKNDEGVRYLLQAVDHYHQLLPCTNFEVDLSEKK